MVNLNENPGQFNPNHLTDHAALKEAYLSRGAGRTLPDFTQASINDGSDRRYGVIHDQIHATLHAEHNALGAVTTLPSTTGDAGHLAHHAALAKAHNLRSASSDIAVSRGVNAAGAEFGVPNNINDTANAAETGNGTYNSDASFAYYFSRGHNTIRIPFAWGRMQPTINGELDTTELSRLKSAVASVNSRGMKVILDCHNYALYKKQNMTATGTITGAALGDLWSRLANVSEFKNNDLVQFDIMNEPQGLAGATFRIQSQLWESMSQTTVSAIRATGANNWIWVEGYDYSPAGAFWDANHHANTWWINDSLNRTGVSAHIYFDSGDGWGGGPGYYSTDGRTYDSTLAKVNANNYYTVANGFSGNPVAHMIIDNLKNFVNGCVSNNIKGHIGEMGWDNSGTADNIANWNIVGDQVYTYLDSVKMPVTYWAAGELWGPPANATQYIMSAYTGTPQSALASPATVIEAHAQGFISPYINDAFTDNLTPPGPATTPTGTQAWRVEAGTWTENVGTLSATADGAIIVQDLGVKTQTIEYTIAGTLTSASAPGSVMLYDNTNDWHYRVIKFNTSQIAIYRRDPSQTTVWASAAGVVKAGDKVRVSVSGATGNTVFQIWINDVPISQTGATGSMVDTDTTPPSGTECGFRYSFASTGNSYQYGPTKMWKSVLAP